MNIEIKNYLVFRLSAMGDVALTVPVLRAAVEQNPNAHFTVVTNAFFAPFFYGIPNVELYSPDLKGRHKGFVGLTQLAKELRKIQKWDAIIDLHSVLRTTVVTTLFKLRGVPIFTIDKGRKEKRAVVSRSRDTTPLKHTTERYCDTFRLAGLSVNNLVAKSIAPQPEASDAMESFLQEETKGLVEPKVLGIAPFAMHSPKMWDIDRVRALLEMISRERPNWIVLLFGGGAKEREQLSELSEGFSSVKSVVGLFKFTEEIALISQLDGMLSMDSGNMHIASLSGTPTISIWGGTHPCFGFSALGQPEENTIQIKDGTLSCRPCSVFGNTPCKKLSKICMDRISVDRVLFAIDGVMLLP